MSIFIIFICQKFYIFFLHLIIVNALLIRQLYLFLKICVHNLDELVSTINTNLNYLNYRKCNLYTIVHQLNLMHIKMFNDNINVYNILFIYIFLFLFCLNLCVGLGLN